MEMDSEFKTCSKIMMTHTTISKFESLNEWKVIIIRKKIQKVEEINMYDFI
jgi:hypothetical protein